MTTTTTATTATTTTTATTATTATKRPAKDFECQECGRKMTLKQAERATYGNGCPKCGGCDIDLAVS